MFLLSFFLIIALMQLITNKLLNVSDDNAESYYYSKKESLIIVCFLIVSATLQFTSPMFERIFWHIIATYSFCLLITMLVFTSLKKNRIVKQREEIEQIYAILQKMVDKKNEGLDFNNVPFSCEYKYGKINRIKVNVEPTSFDEKILSMILQQLNAFLPTFTWGYELKLDERYMTFVGNDKPPNLARWPGSWLRHFRYMPVGISGNGEVAWQPDSIQKDRMASSQYLDSKGNPIPTDTSVPRQPQGLVCGAPLSLDTIIPTTVGYKSMKTIQVGDFVFSHHNKPTKVIEVHDIKTVDFIYEFTFTSKENTIVINADIDHRWLIKHNYIETTSFFLGLGDIIPGLISDYTVTKKCRLAKKTAVRCIKVASPSHLFAVTDKTNNTNAVLTLNTGGGKSIYVNQEIE